MKLISKQQIAADKGVTPKTIDHWVAAGLLPPPIKFGNLAQSRVRWTATAVAVLDRNLAAMGDTAPKVRRPGYRSKAVATA